MGYVSVSPVVFECIREWWVCSFSVSVPVVRVFTDFCVKDVIEVRFRDAFSVNGFRGLGRDTHTPAGWALWLSPFVPVSGPCKEFWVPGASVL